MSLPALQGGSPDLAQERGNVVLRLIARVHGYHRMARMAPHLNPLTIQAGFGEVHTGEAPVAALYARGQTVTAIVLDTSKRVPRSHSASA